MRDKLLTLLFTVTLLITALISSTACYAQVENNTTYLNSTYLEVNYNSLLSNLLKTFDSTYKESNYNSILSNLLKTFSSNYIEENINNLLSKLLSTFNSYLLEVNYGPNYPNATAMFEVVYPKPGNISVGYQEVIYKLNIPPGNESLYKYVVRVLVNGEEICSKEYPPGVSGTYKCPFVILEKNKTYTIDCYFEEYVSGNLVYTNKTTIVVNSTHYPFKIDIVSPPNGTILNTSVLNVTLNVVTPISVGIKYVMTVSVFNTIEDNATPVISESKDIPAGINGTVYARITFNTPGDYWILAYLKAWYNDTLVDYTNSSAIMVTVPKEVIQVEVPGQAPTTTGGGVVFQPQPVYVPINETNVTQVPPTNVTAQPETKTVVQIVKELPTPLKVALLALVTILVIIALKKGRKG